MSRRSAVFGLWPMETTTPDMSLSTSIDSFSPSLNSPSAPVACSFSPTSRFSACVVSSFSCSVTYSTTCRRNLYVTLPFLLQRRNLLLEHAVTNAYLLLRGSRSETPGCTASTAGLRSRKRHRHHQRLRTSCHEIPALHMSRTRSRPWYCARQADRATFTLHRQRRSLL